MNPWPMRILIGGIAITFCAPMVGLSGTVLGMIRSFNTLGTNGITDPKALASDVGQVLTSTMAGLVVSTGVGLPLIVIGAILLATRRKASVPPVS